MKIKINKNYIKINKVDGFMNRFKCMKFILEPLKEGFFFEKRKFFSSYFFCQNVDIVMTDKNNNILFMYPNFESEKRILPKKRVYNTYILPVNTCKYLTIGKKLIIKN